jgi:hypothetical protein
MKYKKYFLIILIFLLIDIASSLGITMYPAEIYFYEHSKNNICKNYTLEANKETVLIGKLLWLDSIEGYKKLEKYKNSSNEFNIKSKFKNNLLVFEKKEYELCLNFNKKGNYEGALVYFSENGYAGIGSWIHAKIYEKTYNKNRLNLFLTLLTFSNSLFFVLLILIYKKNSF